jgi:hypothetical protein
MFRLWKPFNRRILDLINFISFFSGLDFGEVDAISLPVPARMAMGQWGTEIKGPNSAQGMAFARVFVLVVPWVACLVASFTPQGPRI